MYSSEEWRFCTIPQTRGAKIKLQCVFLPIEGRKKGKTKKFCETILAKVHACEEKPAHAAVNGRELKKCTHKMNSTLDLGNFTAL